jgi:alkylation response protein AidB-like acyl-CoA dehydrogenase
MPIGITEEHQALHESVRGLLARHCPPAVVRATLDGGDGSGPAGAQLPPFWDRLAGAGLLGLHLPEEYGGSGAGLPELAVAAEELGRAAAPGPFLPTVLASAAIALAADTGAAKELLPPLADGTLTAAVAFDSEPLTGEPEPRGLRIRGWAGPVLSAAAAGLVLLPVTGPDGSAWAAVDADELTITPASSLDATRPLATVEAAGVVVPIQRRLDVSREAVRRLAAILLAAESVGVAGWCLTTASDHARARVQFGRPIGTFQGVKHHCADLLVAVEQAAGASWDAARAGVRGDEAALAAATAATLGPDAAVHAAKGCVQILGGIGFTWEHDAHVYLKRAMTLRLLAGRSSSWRAQAAALAASGVRRSLTLDLPAEAEAHRTEAREFLAGVHGLSEEATRAHFAAAGYVAPHWPRPWGRSAGPLEQVVIEEEIRRSGVKRPNLGIAAWVVPTLITHGTGAQRERFLGPALSGEATWCQLFSEPGAGSDLAAISTRAEQVEGGWRINGQKVWTSLAAQATHAILLARNEPLDAAHRHAGMTYFIVDMSDPGIDVRPLREITGASLFNEVFLTDVFVPDDCVIGEIGDGWAMARTTLANERVNIGSGSTFGNGVEALLRDVGDRIGGDAVLADRIGALVIEASSLALLGHRSTLRAIHGEGPGAESSVRKLLGVEHEQRVHEAGLSAYGAAGALTDGPASSWSFGFLATRSLTIAGGTSEVQRNVIAERLLGLPRDPLPGR